MLRKVVAGIAIVGIATGVTGRTPASAAETGLSWSDPASVFEVREQYGTTCGSSGFSFRDEDNYSFDNGGLVTVEGTYIGTGATKFDLASAGSDALSTYPQIDTQQVGDLGVSVSYRTTSTNIIRTIVSITNNGTTDATDVKVNIENTVPSDSRVYYVDGGTWRSSGDWFVMGEEGFPDRSIPWPSPEYPSSFHAPDGPGSPESPATIAVCNGSLRNLPLVEPTSGFNETELVFGYLVDIPVGATRRIMVIQGAGGDGDVVSDVIQKGQTFNPAGQTPESGILSDLRCDDALTVVNWDFSGCGSEGGGPQFSIDLDHYVRRAAEESALPDTL